MRYAIRFDWPEGEPTYAGLHKGAFGWAPTLATALIYDTREQAESALKNGYGGTAVYGSVVEAKP